MIQVAPQMRILVAIEPADFRNYAGQLVMLSQDTIYAWIVARHGVSLGIMLVLQDERSIARSLSGGLKRPRRRDGATLAFNVASFSVGSARR